MKISSIVNRQSGRERLWITIVEVFLVLFGMRDRLRCPTCHVVGTWKPHGSLITERNGRPVARWLCKWCGYYEGPEEGISQATMRPKTNTWEIDLACGEQPDTPKSRMFHDAIARDESPPNPWGG